MNKTLSVFILFWFCLSVSAGNKIIIAGSDKPYSSQTWFYSGSGNGLQQQKISDNWDEGRRITSAAYTPFGWFIAMSSNSGYTRQTYHYASEWPSDWISSKVNYRNHRKIVVIDGKVGYIGGMNIARRYVYGFDWGIWHDTHAKISGKAVYGLQTAFLIDWFAVERSLITSPEYFPKHIETEKSDFIGSKVASCSSIAQIVTSDPVGRWRDIMQGYVMAINSAKSYVYIQTPYLLPTEPVLTALQTAALAGVDVRIMIPKRGDSWIIHKGTMSYIDEMLEAGVKVYMYKKGFLHSKLMVSDDVISTVGSTNMDFRSFEHNFEANAFFYDKETALAIKEIFLKDIKSCLLLTPKIWNSRSVSSKIAESVIRLFSPLL